MFLLSQRNCVRLNFLCILLDDLRPDYFRHPGTVLALRRLEKKGYIRILHKDIIPKRKPRLYSYDNPRTSISRNNNIGGRYETWVYIKDKVHRKRNLHHFEFNDPRPPRAKVRGAMQLHAHSGLLNNIDSKEQEASEESNDPLRGMLWTYMPGKSLSRRTLRTVRKYCELRMLQTTGKIVRNPEAQSIAMNLI